LAHAASSPSFTSELCLRPIGDCKIEGKSVVFELPAEDVKTRKGRPVPVLDPRVSDRVAVRILASRSPDAPLFPSPSDASKQWEPRGRDRKLAALYEEIAIMCRVPVLAVERGHIWRATLNSLLADVMDEDVRIRLLGHTREINRQLSTAVSDTSRVVAAASVLRASSRVLPAAGK
jgi:hypothetical protein